MASRMPRWRRVAVVVAVLAALAAVIPVIPGSRHLTVPVMQMLTGRKSVAERMTEHGATVAARLGPACQRVGVAYPPAEVAFLAFKDVKSLEVYARDDATTAWRQVTAYPILAASGSGGPKLREGDRQVPEGIYGVESLNPNSLYHLALRVGYPNAFDRARARADGRTSLGGDIMIHGRNDSIGCLAMGDRAIEDLFVVTAHAGIDHVSVIIAPTDFRSGSSPPAGGPSWVGELYAAITSALTAFPAGR
ncbi:MAG: hypothetical protein H0W83_10720 [Planctomycetes bacterium]|nr:hypothetical protein [Planctomycetota bacterium]